jgi:hypothetical protein
MTKEEFQDAARRFILYFEPAVLASYRQESHRYEVMTDNFDGKVRIRSDFYASLPDDARRDAYVGVDFGFRAKADGSLAVAAWAPDIAEKTSPAERQKWIPFQIPADQFPIEFDERFSRWMRCHIGGDWYVESGPLQRLVETVVETNAVTVEAVGLPLFRAEESADLLFPAADNDTAYSTAHAGVYHFIVDGLNKETLELLARRFGVTGNFSSDRTVKALKQLVTDTSIHAPIFDPLDLVSDKRRQSDHGARGRASPFPAFNQFSDDIETVVRGLDTLKRFFATKLKLDVQNCVKRQERLKMLPKLDPDRPPQPNYSIVQANSIVGKTVERVEYGFRAPISGVHDSEVLILHFTDGSILGIDTGSNAKNLADDQAGLKAEDFHSSFMLAFVPPKE